MTMNGTNDMKDNSNYRLDPPEAEPAQHQWVEVEQVKWDGDRFIAKLK